MNEVEFSYSPWSSWVRWIVYVVISLMLAAIFFPINVNCARESVVGQCGSSIGYMALAMQIYSIDHENRLPPRTWVKELKPYLRDMPVDCPSVTQKNKRGGFAMNSQALALDSFTVKDPAKFVLFFETDALSADVVANLAARNRDRHDKEGKIGSNISMLDGSGRFVLKEEKLE